MKHLQRFKIEYLDPNGHLSVKFWNDTDKKQAQRDFERFFPGIRILKIKAEKRLPIDGKYLLSVY